jgi:hypothetical protein
LLSFHAALTKNGAIRKHTRHHSGIDLTIRIPIDPESIQFGGMAPLLANLASSDVAGRWVPVTARDAKKPVAGDACKMSVNGRLMQT